MHINWRSPAVQGLMFTLIDRLIIRRAFAVESVPETGLRQALDRIQTLEQQVQNGASTNPPQIQTTDIAHSVTDDGPDEIRRSITNASAMLKEAGRFAREDGMAHPEVQMRLSDTEAILTDLERFQLSPERVQGLPSNVQAQARAMLPELRRLRQQVYNAMDSPEDLDRAAARAGEMTTRYRAATAGMPLNQPAPIVEPPRSHAVTTVNPRPYSLYAPEMEIDTGCIPCGRAHLGAVQAELEGAAADAQTEGMQSPRVQARLASADEELAALFAYDWTPQRIERSPEADKRVLVLFKPRIESLQGEIASVNNPDDLARLAAQARDLRTEFRTATNAGGNKLA